MIYGRDPEEWEICQYLHLDRAKAAELRKAAVADKIASLDSPVKDGEEEYTLADMVPGETDAEGEILDCVQQEQLNKTLWEAVDSLPGEQSEVIRKRYQKDMNLKETGEHLEIPSGKVSRIEHKALRELRTGHKKELIHFLPEYLEAKVYHGCGVAAFHHSWTSSTERTALELCKYIQKIKVQQMKGE